MEGPDPPQLVVIATLHIRFQPYTYTVCRSEKDGQYFFTHLLRDRHPINPGSLLAPDHLEGIPFLEIPLDTGFPLFNPEFTPAPEPVPGTLYPHYIKRPWFFKTPGSPGGYLDFKDDILHEAEICEILRKHPHPCIDPYLGCIVEKNRITGLVFPDYDYNVAAVLRSERAWPGNVDACIAKLRNGVEHLHRLGLVHNNIHEANVALVNGTMDPVITDFSMCQKQGETMRMTP
ncbi:hypothetical protein N0V88_000656 [Collariella sp. IMI 366227]|nr:hypothetical protein N0V88_000656 [Collariella sp. IMI 366227]